MKAANERLNQLLAQLVGRQVRRIRRDRRLSQRQLAARAGSRSPIISRLERGAGGTPSLETLRPIARALNVDLHSLLLGLNWSRIDRLARSTVNVDACRRTA